MLVLSLGQEDSLEEGMVTHPVFLPGESHGLGTWQATVHSFTQSWTQLKQLIKHTCTQLLLRGLGDIYIYQAIRKYQVLNDLGNILILLLN